MWRGSSCSLDLFLPRLLVLVERLLPFGQLLQWRSQYVMRWLIHNSFYEWDSGTPRHDCWRLVRSTGRSLLLNAPRRTVVQLLSMCNISWSRISSVLSTCPWLQWWMCSGLRQGQRAIFMIQPSIAQASSCNDITISTLVDELERVLLWWWWAIVELTGVLPFSVQFCWGMRDDPSAAMFRRPSCSVLENRNPDRNSLLRY